MFRSDPTERTHSTLPTTRTGNRILQHLSGWKAVTRHTLTEIADQFHHWVTNRSQKWGTPVVEAPLQERRDEFVLPYLQKTEADHVAVILKAREPARILVAIGGKRWAGPCHLARAARVFLNVDSKVAFFSPSFAADSRARSAPAR